MRNHSLYPLYDVVIAGAGPVGLFLACELRLAAVSVLVLAQAEDPHSPLKRLPFGLRGLWGPAIEAFHRRGLLEQVAAAQPRRDALPRPSAVTSGSRCAVKTDGARSGPGGHFAGIQFDYANIDTSRWPYRLPGPADAQFGIEMAELERILETRALALGVEIRRGQGVDGFDAASEEVVVHAGERGFHARWLVGCDGGRSTVRRLGGFEFVGTEPEFTGYSVQADIAETSPLPLGRHHTSAGMYTQWQPGVIAIADFDGGAFHRTTPLTLEHVQAVFRRVSDTAVTLTAIPVASTWTDGSKQATTYRKGRVLLAGDAAHIHSPLGGQGLNLGLGDAMNLGWKLAATIRDNAPEDLLDSYTTERHPIGASILDWTRAQVALMRPSSRALRDVVRDLIDTRDGATYFAEKVWGISRRYDLGNLHPLVGCSAPDFKWNDGTRLGVLLRDGIGVLLDFAGDTALRSIGERLRGMLKYSGDAAIDCLGLSVVLVRPDGVVAWACTGEPDMVVLMQALSQWLPMNRHRERCQYDDRTECSKVDAMTTDLLLKARAGDEQAFRALIDAHQRELQVHCYRMLGSMQDAEDALQDTLMAAWQGLGRFEERASLRTWLYRIATNKCLNALRATRRRPAKAWDVPGIEPPEPTRLGETAWLGPFPDALLDGEADTLMDPAPNHERHESISLAFVTALQLLPPRQLAVLVLRDVLEFPASEVAAMLRTSVQSVNSALSRARENLERYRAREREQLPAPVSGSPAESAIVSRFVQAYETADVAALIALLTDDVFVSMPPMPLEYVGRELAARFFEPLLVPGRQYSLVPTRANGSPAFGAYMLRPDNIWHGSGLFVVTLSGESISALTRFETHEFARFGLPATRSAP